MMQRKKNIGTGGGTTSANSNNDGTSSALSSSISVSNPAVAGDDDGGAAKRKSSHAFLGSSSRAAANFSSYCLPGVPVVLKFVLLSFLGFVGLILLTANSDHHPHRARPGGLGSTSHPGGRGAMHDNMLHGIPRMPEPLHAHLQRTMEKQPVDSHAEHHEAVNNNDVEAPDGKDRSASMEATERMLAQPSRFVDSEKKLKRQLLQLLEKQSAEKRSHKKLDNDSILGVKISNRFLGDELLPYPESKAKEHEWIQQMEHRKEELRNVDEKEWKELMQQYEDIMEDYDTPKEHEGNAILDSDAQNSHNVGESNSDNQNSVDKGGLDHPILELPPQEIPSSPDADKKAPSSGVKKWPSPTEKAGPNIDIILKPAFGTHRSSSNAVLVFAEGYDLSIYLALVESLVSTGFNGDLVLSISNEKKLKPGVKDYLMSKNSANNGGKGVNVVAYEVEWTCFDKSSGKPVHGTGEGMHHCQMNQAFGDASTGTPIPDPRDPRPVATARYELYWMWSLQYSKESWIMLIDARDVWFQLDPFEGLHSNGITTNDESGELMGELLLFGVSSCHFNTLLLRCFWKGEITSLFVV